jgi:hypothetical protein
MGFPATCGGSHGCVAAIALSEGERCSKVHSTESEWTKLWSPAATRSCTSELPPEPEVLRPPNHSSTCNLPDSRRAAVLPPSVL